MEYFTTAHFQRLSELAHYSHQICIWESQVIPAASFPVRCHLRLIEDRNGKHLILHPEGSQPLGADFGRQINQTLEKLSQTVSLSPVRPDLLNTANTLNQFILAAPASFHQLLEIAGELGDLVNEEAPNEPGFHLHSQH